MVTKHIRSHVAATIRKALATSGKSRYAIAAESGVTQDRLSRFVHRKAGLGIAGLEALARALGLQVVVVRQKALKKGKG